jgi:VanZ family protein
VILLPWRWPARMKGAAYGLANLILLYLCLAPSKDLPGVSLWDKAEHGLAWTVLTGVGLLMWPGRPWRVVPYAAVLGAVVEVLQATLPFGRDGQFSDWVADCVGIALAVVVWATARLLLRRRAAQ